MRPRDLQPCRVAICTPYKRPRYVTQERDNNGKLPPRCKYVPLHKSDESSVLFFLFCVVFVFCPFCCQFTSPMTCHVWEFPARVLTFMCQQKGRERGGEKKRSVHILHKSCESELTALFPPAQNGFAVVRPPGHHADPSNAM